MSHICSLCEKEIKNYKDQFNHLEIDPTHSIDICMQCVDTFTRWQQKNFAALFPTKAAKNFIKNREK